MQKFEGKIILQVEQEGNQTHYASEESAVLDTEEYLNGDVASEVYKRYGVSLRVHVQGEPVR